MLIFLIRGIAASAVGRGLMLTVARGVAGAAASGVGWKLGSDTYEAVKRWCAENLEYEPLDYEYDEQLDD